MLPPIDTSLMPPEVRKAGPEAVKLYGAALQFEGLLTSQITQQMFDATQDTGGGDDEDDSDGTGSGSDGGPYQSMLPSALADSITQSGGLGLAHQLYLSFGGAYLTGTQSSGQTPPSSQDGEE
jgi:Rod binding domain-containing protein